MSTWPRNLELLRLSPIDFWTLDEACLGTLITGGTGSGKTTSPLFNRQIFNAKEDSIEARSQTAGSAQE